jgi:hypothetical protein
MALTFTYEREVGGIARVIAAWTSDGSGDASGTTAVRVCGRLVKATTDPGSAAPTDNYDITITDDEGVNVLTACQSSLLNRDTANSEEVYFLVLDAAGTALAQSVHPVVCSALTFTVANAGASKTGQIILYVQGALDGAF